MPTKIAQDPKPNPMDWLVIRAVPPKAPGKTQTVVASAVAPAFVSTAERLRDPTLRKDKFLGFQFADLVAELGGQFEFEALGGLAHVVFQLRDKSVKFIL